jgi:hypothetical protein
MHSFVHEWSRLRVPKEMLDRVESAAIRLLCYGEKPDNYWMMQYLVSHTQALSFAWGDLHTNDAASFGFISEESGMYADAMKSTSRVRSRDSFEQENGEELKSMIHNRRRECDREGCLRLEGHRGSHSLLRGLSFIIFHLMIF